MPALEKLSIDTPEQVALEFSLATVGSRFLALAIDTLVQAACMLVLVVVAGLAVFGSRLMLNAASQWLLAVFVLGTFLVYYGYFALFESLWNGQTPGKRVIGLRVIHASGRPVSVLEAILRNVVRIVDQMPGIYAIGIISAFVTERSQRLGDLAAGTVVVHERPVSMDQQSFAAAGPPAGLPTHHGAGKLTAEEMSMLELFLFRRREQLDAYARLRAAQRIASYIRNRLGITTIIDDERLLEEVAAEYRALQRFG
ncbi:MAG: RDD family protein [Acidobacteria bacterium]|nr:RDD family protein [Acidobacteriota bacterium]